MITNQAFLFSIFVINGLLIGLLFDIFRILRISFKTKDFVTYIEDIIFWILTGAIILYSIFVFNNGEIRFYIFLGILIGIIFYMTLFSTYIIKFSVEIINFIKKIMGKILKIIFTPFIYLGKLIKKILFKPIAFITINIKKKIYEIIKKPNLARQKMQKS
ncbi:MAG: spore cortex biosynthesis protein YabQ [Clostridia bacterium]|nr:spore cortex biosynthesis protein YabQ [Clostridia bacterium]